MKSLFVTFVYLLLSILLLSQSNKQQVYQHYAKEKKVKTKTLINVIDDNKSICYTTDRLKFGKSDKNIFSLLFTKKNSNSATRYLMIGDSINKYKISLLEKPQKYSLKKAAYIKENNKLNEKINAYRIKPFDQYYPPLILDFKVMEGKEEKMGNYNCKIGEYVIDRDCTYKVWFTNELNYNWAFADYYRYVPGTIVKVMQNVIKY